MSFEGVCGVLTVQTVLQVMEPSGERVGWLGSHSDLSRVEWGMNFP